VLTWHLEYGQKADWFQEIEEQGGAEFDFLDDKPELYEDLYGDWKAFWRLSGSRQIGMGLGSIQMSEILAYMEIFGIHNTRERELLLTRIQILDRTFLKHHSKKDKKKKKNAKAARGRK